MTTYTGNIFPLCQGIAKCASEQNATFTTKYLNTGEVKYFDKSKEKGKVTHPQRLDDFYGTVTSLSIQPPSSVSDKEKKAVIQQCLNEYHSKEASARAYLIVAMGEGVKATPPKNAVQWFDGCQETLNSLVQNLQSKLNGWNP